LYEQISRPKPWQLECDVKVEVSPVSAGIRVAEGRPATRAAKLRTVERFIQKHHSIGSVDAPGNEYFGGEADMAWGWLNTERREMLLFQAHQPLEQHTLVLVGSGRHFIGEQQGGSTDLPVTRNHSFLPVVLWELNNHISRSPELAPYFNSRFTEPEQLSRRDRDRWAQFLYHRLFPTPMQRVQFMAVKLVEHELDDWEEKAKVTLATPLYVAHAH
jgi:hypothetical protein